MELKTYRQVIQAMLDRKQVQACFNNSWLDCDHVPYIPISEIDSKPIKEFRLTSDVEAPEPVRDAKQMKEMKLVPGELSKEELIEFIRHERHDTQPNGGIPLLDYFAARAMQGLLSNPAGPVQSNNMSGWSFTNCTTDDVADLAYTLADAMLAAAPNHIPDVGKMGAPTDTEILQYVLDKALVIDDWKNSAPGWRYSVKVGRKYYTGETQREAIAKAMQDETRGRNED